MTSAPPSSTVSTPDVSAPDKPGLRAELRRRRKAFVAREDVAGDLLVLTLMVAERAAAHLPAEGIVAAYVAMGAEVDPTPLLFQAIDRGLTVALPRLEVDDGLTFRRWDPGDELVPGPSGIFQPRRDAPEVQPDLIVVPLVGFDRQLNRLGQGAGHYDRTLAARPDARRIGLAWSIQEVEAIPADPWDMPLHGIATERGWIAA